MMRGSPPTARKARTGLFTPPTRTFSARSKISRQRRRSLFNAGRVALMIGAPGSTLFEPARGVFCVIRQDNVCACALNSREQLEHDALFIEPPVLHRGLHHGVLAADIVSRDGDVKARSEERRVGTGRRAA